MEKYKVYFTKSIDRMLDEEFIGSSKTFEGACAIAKAELAKRSYHESPYWRYLLAPDATYIDFGNWSIFIAITPRVTQEDFLK